MDAAEMKNNRGARRKAHFANGGSIATWRGRARRFEDRKKARSKKACRGKVRL